MPDPRQTIEQIRAALTSRDGASRDIAATAVEYADFCREANSRLRRCADFLRDGLLGEAVAHANGSPPLLDFVEALEFAELPQWESKCAVMGLGRPTRIAFETVPDIRKAFESYEPLRELLAKHRYLALARASLGDRLTILHELVSADPQNADWKRETEEMERVRLAEIRAEAAGAVRAADAEIIARLAAELNVPWLIAGADELRESLRQTAASILEATAASKLRTLVPAIHAALTSGSIEQAQQVFLQWGQVVKSARIAVPPDLREEIMPLALWLDAQEEQREREREFRTACEDLAATIHIHAPQELLTARYKRAADFGFEIPDELMTSYRRALQFALEQQRREKRKQLALGTLLVAVIAIVLALGAYVIYKTAS